MQSEAFPGRLAVLSRFQTLIAGGSLGQSYVMWGPEGSGKEITSLQIARMANCLGREACQAPPWCESCRKALSFQHPDIRWLGPAPATLDTNGVRDLLAQKQLNPFYQPAFAASSYVTIGDPDSPGPLTVRSLLRFLRLRSFQGRTKVAIVTDAHRMTDEAANSFLKTLEEPPPASLIFLLTTHRTGLLPTILSRCQQVRFEPYSESELADTLSALVTVDRGRLTTVIRLADGNARRAMALLQPQMAAMLNWAGVMFDWIHSGMQGSVQLAADHLHAGTVPAEVVPPDCEQPLPAAKELVAKRERAIQLCEMLNLYYSEALICRERKRQWRPRIADAIDRVRRIAEQRSSTTLLQDIARVESAKVEIDGNLNIGLTMAALGQDLMSHAERDKQTTVA